MTETASKLFQIEVLIRGDNVSHPDRVVSPRETLISSSEEEEMSVKYHKSCDCGGTYISVPLENEYWLRSKIEHFYVPGLSIVNMNDGRLSIRDGEIIRI